MSGSPSMFYVQSIKRAIPVSSILSLEYGEDHEDTISIEEKQRTIVVIFSAGKFFNIYRTREERDNTMYAYTWTNPI
jgi:hypothetical protein